MSSLELLHRASIFLEREDGRSAFRLLKNVRAASWPLVSKAEYFESLGQALVLMGNYRPAKDALRRAHRLFQQRGDSEGTKSTRMRLGDMERQLENFPAALRLYRSVLQRRSSHFDPDARLGIALSERGLGRFEKACRTLHSVLAYFKHKRDALGLAYTHWALATTLRFLGDLKQAGWHAKKSLDLYRRSQDLGGEAFALCAAGGIARMRGEARHSFAHYRRANQIFRKLNDQFGEAYSSCGMANAHRMQRNFKRAWPYSKRAEILYRKLNLPGPLGFVLWSQSQMRLDELDHPRARTLLTETEKLFKRVGDERGLVYADLGWGEYHRSQNNPIATRFFQKALKIAQRLGMKQEVLHAQSRLHPRREFWKAYHKLGVSPRTRRYSSWP